MTDDTQSMVRTPQEYVAETQDEPPASDASADLPPEVRLDSGGPRAVRTPVGVRAGATRDSAHVSAETAAVRAEGFCLYYGQKVGVADVTMAVAPQSVTAIIGPSGCGKSTFLRSVNRMNDLVPGARASGRLEVSGTDVYDRRINLVHLRQQVGMVFQKPNPFPKTIYDNIAFGPRLQGVRRRGRLDEIVETSLRDAALWEEVKDELHKSALALSGGQQQRLCIARALATQPDVLLMDEPCSALDPVATGRIEDLIAKLREHYTIVIVTHNMQQASRVSQRTAFFCLGKLVEYGMTKDIFTNPREQQTEDYVTGRFG